MTVIGFRWFDLSRSGGLLSITGGEIWPPTETLDAVCDYRSHPAPQMDCSCGLYAFRWSEDCLYLPREYNNCKVLAAVECWGRVCFHSVGLRAEHARVGGVWVARGHLSDLYPVLHHSSAEELVGEWELEDADA